MQSEVGEITIRTDADWAGCRRSRKSTSGGTISRGSHCIKAWSKTQAVIAKSSAESELYGVVRGACEGIGTKTLCADLGDEVSVSLELDATAAKGILDRSGLQRSGTLTSMAFGFRNSVQRRSCPSRRFRGRSTSRIS